MRLVNRAACCDDTNPLLMKPHVLRVMDWVYFKIMQIVTGSSANILFHRGDGLIRDVCTFVVPKAKKKKSILE